MNGRTIARILLAIVLIGGAIGLGVTAYNAGVTAGLVQSGQAVVVPGGVPSRPAPPTSATAGASATASASSASSAACCSSSSCSA